MRKFIRSPKFIVLTIFLMILFLPTLFIVAEDEFNDEDTDYYYTFTPSYGHPDIQIDIAEDQDDVYYAVQNGQVRPFSELYDILEREINGRIIQVKLDEEENDYDQDIWIYKLKVLHKNNVIRLNYNAETLKLIQIKGRNYQEIFKNSSKR